MSLWCWSYPRPVRGRTSATRRSGGPFSSRSSASTTFAANRAGPVARRRACHHGQTLGRASGRLSTRSRRTGFSVSSPRTRRRHARSIGPAYDPTRAEPCSFGAPAKAGHVSTTNAAAGVRHRQTADPWRAKGNVKQRSAASSSTFLLDRHHVRGDDGSTFCWAGRGHGRRPHVGERPLGTQLASQADPQRLSGIAAARAAGDPTTQPAALRPGDKIPDRATNPRHEPGVARYAASSATPGASRRCATGRPVHPGQPHRRQRPNGIKRSTRVQWPTRLRRSPRIQWPVRLQRRLARRLLWRTALIPTYSAAWR